MVFFLNLHCTYSSYTCCELKYPKMIKNAKKLKFSASVGDSSKKCIKKIGVVRTLHKLVHTLLKGWVEWVDPIGHLYLIFKLFFLFSPLWLQFSLHLIKMQKLLGQPYCQKQHISMPFIHEINISVCRRYVGLQQEFTNAQDFCWARRLSN